jgi:23S rRNA pseudouridine955/2504/2580 synthase
MLVLPIILEETANQTLISFLKKRLQTTPLSLIYKLFRTKKIKVNDKDVRYYHYRLKIGDEIKIFDNSLKISDFNISPTPKKVETNLTIIYQDQKILIALKEHGTTMPSLDNMVRYYLSKEEPDEYQKQLREFFTLTAIHRLDKLTKGLVIYAKNISAKRILYKAISDKKKITKKYLALVESSPKKIPNYIEGYLWKDEKEKRMKFSWKENSPNSKFCALEMKKIKEMANYQLLEITLWTGRKHQIRSILSFFDCPVVGDKKYGSKIKLEDKIYLLAYQIKFGNLSTPLNYLNGQIFQAKGWENELKEWRINKNL